MDLLDHRKQPQRAREPGSERPEYGRQASDQFPVRGLPVVDRMSKRRRTTVVDHVEHVRRLRQLHADEQIEQDPHAWLDVAVAGQYPPEHRVPGEQLGGGGLATSEAIRQARRVTK